jgi:hypothetical protein
MRPGEEYALALEVDGDGVVRVLTDVKQITLTPRELGRVLTLLMSALVAQDGDDEQEVNLN